MVYRVIFGPDTVQMTPHNEALFLMRSFEMKFEMKSRGLSDKVSECVKLKIFTSGVFGCILRRVGE